MSENNTRRGNPGAFVESMHAYLVVGILLSALALRIAALSSLKETIYFDFLLWDERLYQVWAEQIADGTYKSSTVYEFAPLPAYWMAFVYRMFSVNTEYIRFANIAFGVLTCGCVYLIGKELAGKTVGLIACLLAALYKPFVFYSIVLLKTSMTVLFFALTAWLMLSFLANPRRLNRLSEGIAAAPLLRIPRYLPRGGVKSFLLGIVIGMLLNVRPQAGVFLPILPLVLLGRCIKKEISINAFIAYMILYIVGFLVAVSPFVIRNYKVAGRFALTSSQSGFNLYLGNNLDNPDPYYLPVPFATSSPFEQGVQFTIEASRRVGSKLTSQQASSFWRNEIIKTAREAAVRFMEKLGLKFLALFQSFQASDHFDIGFISRFAPFFAFPFPNYTLIFPIGMIGMMMGLFHSDKAQVLGGMWLLYGLTLIIFFTNDRYALPLMAILIPCAAEGMKTLWSFWLKGEKRKLLVAGIVLGIFFVIENLPVPGRGDMTAYYNTHAIALKSVGQEEEAIQYWKSSSEMNGRASDFANLSLARIYFKKRDAQTAVSYLNKIGERSFAAAPKWALIGDALKSTGQIEQAIEAYEHSLAINSGQRNVRLALAKMLERVDPQKARLEYEKLEYISSFYDVFE